MYCKKCKYHAFDHLSSCPRCGVNWEETRKALHLAWLTTPGHNWFAQPKTEDQAEGFASVEGLEVGNLPDLSFERSAIQSGSMDAYAPNSDQLSDQTAPNFLSKEDPGQGFIDLDFSLPEVAPLPVPPAESTKHEALFIPELEEMLAPLANEHKPAPPKKETKKNTGENDIYLDFSQSRQTTPVKPDMAEMDLLNFDIKK